jgi:ribose transport system permease protein
MLFILWILISLLAWFTLSKKIYGRKIYAVGNSETCSLFSGINVKMVKVSAYALCSMMSALAGMLYAGKVSQLYLGMGDAYQMSSISAVAIGGISLVGGSGSYVGAMAGCFVIVILDGLLTALNFSQGIQKIIYGIVLFTAVYISSKRQK